MGTLRLSLGRLFVLCLTCACSSHDGSQPAPDRKIGELSPSEAVALCQETLNIYVEVHGGEAQALQDWCRQGSLWAARSALEAGNDPVGACQQQLAACLSGGLGTMNVSCSPDEGCDAIQAEARDCARKIAEFTKELAESAPSCDDLASDATSKLDQWSSAGQAGSTEVGEPCFSERLKACHVM